MMRQLPMYPRQNAQVGNAKINIGYSLIKAPVDGYIGRIHIKTGSLVGISSLDPIDEYFRSKGCAGLFFRE